MAVEKWSRQGAVVAAPESWWVEGRACQRDGHLEKGCGPALVSSRGNEGGTPGGVTGGVVALT